MTSLCHRSVPVRRPSGFRTGQLSLPRVRAGALAALLVGGVLACGDDPVEPPVATTVTVAPATASLSSLGETVQLGATVRDQNGDVMTGAPVRWASGDEAVASVDADGLVTAGANGMATITATSGTASGTASVTVAQAPAAVAVTPGSVTLAAVGETAQFSATVQDANGHAVAGAALSWASEDEAVATVDANGLVTAVANGTATITATSGSLSGSGTATVMQEAAGATVAPDSVHLTAAGETAQFTAQVTDANGHVIDGAAVTWASADEAVATVDANGLVTAVADGATMVTATSGGASASAAVTVMLQAAPTAGPPAPTHAADDVISLFSDAYEDVTVDTWSADWDQADVEDVDIAGNAAKKYTNLSFAGIEFTSQTVDAMSATHFRMDLWTPDETAGAAFRVKLVDFGADGAFGGGDDSEHEVVLTADDGLATEEWVQFDLPLTDFPGLAAREHLAQLIISGDPNTVYVDNVYLRRGEGPPPQPEPTEAAPVPGDAAADVISLYSDAYDDVTVDTWSADWDVATVEDVEVSGNATKKYTGFVFAGIEFTSATINAAEMTHFRMDIWTPDETVNAAFKVKLVDFGANGVWDGGGDDSEHEVTITAADGLASQQWVQLDLALADMTGLAATEHMAQLIISGDPNTVYVDNVYFRKGDTAPPPGEPSDAAPTPAHHADSVISFFSDAYTDVTVDTWSADWDQADVEDVQIAGNATKKYTNLTFAGIEFTSSTVDATAMTHFRFDIWTPDETVNAAFKVKLVDFGANGVWDGGGDDTEHEITLTASSDPALATGQWVSYDIPLAEFTGLTARGHLAQLIISGDPNTVFVDNVYLRK
ncbi:MAG: Ig domain-containing protein [Gemmatimonadetes bacterium]|nr:Ig domain-containing protein [Gemmatimonadota bacterium]